MTSPMAKTALVCALFTVLSGVVQAGTGNGLVCVSASCFEAPFSTAAMLAWGHRIATVLLFLVSAVAVRRERSGSTLLVFGAVFALALTGIFGESTLLEPIYVALHTGLSLLLTGVLCVRALGGTTGRMSPTVHLPLAAGTLIYVTTFSITVGWHSAAGCELWPLCEGSGSDPLLPMLQNGSVLGIVALLVGFALPIWHFARELGFVSKALPRLVAMAALAELLVVVSDQLSGVVIGRLLFAHAVIAASAWLFVRLGWLVANAPATSALPSLASPTAQKLRT